MFAFGIGPAAGVLEGHGWGLHTLGDYKRWACLRLLMRCPAGCPRCGGLDGTAEHLLAAHAVPRLAGGLPENPLGPLRLLRADLPADLLRRNIRLVGQVVHGRQNWQWLKRAPGGSAADGVQ